MAEKTGLIMRGCGKMADRQILSQPRFDSALLLDPPDTWEVAEENFGNDLFFLYKRESAEKFRLSPSIK